MTIRREDLDDLYPLSPMQEGILFHARETPDGPAYVEQVVWRVHGAFDVKHYEGAWNDVHARYEALRSVFTHERSREPLQMVLKRRAADVRYESFADLAPDARERRCLEARAAERAERFDLANGPLLRVRVFELEPDAYEIVLTWHHILFDGWTTHALLRDLHASYLARVANEAPALPPLPSYARYVEWLKSRDREASLAFWRTLLAGYEASAEIPRVAARRGVYELERLDVAFDGETDRKLKAFAAAANATPNSIVQAVWGLVVGRYADVNDVVFGAVVSGRSPDVPEIERMPGLLINTIPVRVRWDDGETFAALVARVQQQALDAQPHHAARLAETQQQSEIGAGLIGSLLVFENYPVARLAGAADGAMTIEVVATSEPTTYDLAIVVDPAPALRVSFQYNAAAYPRAQIEALARHFTELLRGAVTAPGEPLAQLDMTTEAEAFELRALNDTTRPYPRDGDLAERFAAAVVQHGARTALVADGAATTYAELDRRANQLAHHLAACGVGPGDRVATLLERSPTMVETVLALVKLGASYVPHDPAGPVARLAFAIADAGIRTVVAPAATDARIPGVTYVHPDADAARIAACPRTPPAHDVRPEAEAMLFYTSGSTGTPKAVRVPHRAVLRLVLNTDYVALGPADRVAHMSNVAFDAATFEIWGALLNGAELHPFGAETALTPSTLRAELRARAITTMWVTAALFNQVVREVPDTFATLDTLLVGGEPLNPKWVKRALARGKPKRLLNGYGPTETCTFATWHEISEVRDGGTVPIGRPLANTTAHVVDRAGRLQPLCAAGELWIGGDAVMLGYLNRPELDAAALSSDPWGAPGGRVYHTGDIVRRNLAGDLEYIGRRDAQVKLRGFRIELGEIETALRGYAGVTDAFVTVHQDEQNGDRRLIAYLVTAEPAAQPIDLALRAHLRPRLPGYMIPAHYVVLERLPLNANGKIDRKSLPAPTTSGMGFGRTFVEPATDLERQLAAIWQKVLGAPSVGRTDNFFELGGHSLSASTAISHIRAELDVEVPIAAFFEAATLEALAAFVLDVQRSGNGPTKLTRIARHTYAAVGKA